ncbi:MAG: hypothetical protein IJ274_16515 [Lachnospiraceae bacterium]|nr:hypothetical protein [Lachnospiraceae bacterium]
MNRELLSEAKIGHLYKDFLAFTEEQDAITVQMDCVEGLRTDNAVLLTLHLPMFCLQLAFIINEHTSNAVVEALDKIEESLGPELFRAIFGTILTDYAEFGITVITAMNSAI